jgi:aspartyl-tRNA synthetase
MTAGATRPHVEHKTATALRTHTCGELRPEHVGERVTLAGWVHNKRDLGGVAFIDLRDHYGITQIVSRPGVEPDLAHMPKETVIQVVGEVVARTPETINDQLDTGAVEVTAEQVEVLGPAAPVPFNVFPEEASPEDQRLRYRFLDLRRSRMHRNIVLRSQVIASIRRRMQDEGFLDMQTPTLTASSPEGARDYLVPSRVHPGKFYALPQAPQQFKQLLMTSGFDRYFQIAPCYRDEDARADRSPGEFYQLDLEMSFATQDDVFEVVERVMHGLFSEFRPDRPVTEPPFPRIPFAEAMEQFGTDKPDLRNPLRMRDATPIIGPAGIRAFEGAHVAGMRIWGDASLSRSQMDRLDGYARELGAAGLAWFIVEEDGSLRGPLAKFVDEAIQPTLVSTFEAEPGDAILMIADPARERAEKLLGGLRDHVGGTFGLLEDAYRFCWVVDFPMYERDEETGQVEFSHNPFSMPQGGIEALNTLDPLDVKAFQYDVVCNGYELSSGAVRNHRPDILYRAFEIVGYSPAQVDERFGALGRAFKLGAPPHAGIAPGVDRIVMLIADEPNIREVIAFPMNQRAEDLLMGAPAPVSEQQLKELHIKLDVSAPDAPDEPPVHHRT